VCTFVDLLNNTTSTSSDHSQYESLKLRTKLTFCMENTHTNIQAVHYDVYKVGSDIPLISQFAVLYIPIIATLSKQVTNSITEVFWDVILCHWVCSS
jgi:hypothetical protein